MKHFCWVSILSRVCSGEAFLSGSMGSDRLDCFGSCWSTDWTAHECSFTSGTFPSISQGASSPRDRTLESATCCLRIAVPSFWLVEVPKGAPILWIKNSDGYLRVDNLFRKVEWVDCSQAMQQIGPINYIQLQSQVIVKQRFWVSMFADQKGLSESAKILSFRICKENVDVCGTHFRLYLLCYTLREKYIL